MLFSARLEMVREMYRNDAEVSPTSPQQNAAVAATSDPFYDRFPWFRLIGRSALSCDNFVISVFHFLFVVLLSDTHSSHGGSSGWRASQLVHNSSR